MDQKNIILLSTIILVSISFSVIPISAQESTIPKWIKGVFGYWIEDKINDKDVIEALEFLIDTNIIEVGNTQIMSEQKEAKIDPFGRSDEPIQKEIKELQDINTELINIKNNEIEKIQTVLENERKDAKVYDAQIRELQSENTKLQNKIGELRDEMQKTNEDGNTFWEKKYKELEKKLANKE